MNLTDENRKIIDSMSMYALLYKIRFSPVGDQWFTGETGDYIMKRYSELRDKYPDEHVSNSKTMGWEK